VNEMSSQPRRSPPTRPPDSTTPEVAPDLTGKEPVEHSLPVPDEIPPFITSASEDADVPTEDDVPPQHDIVDPEPVEVPQAAPVPHQMVEVFIIRNEDSVAVGGSHYSLKAGTTMVLQQPIADELIARKLAQLT